MFPHELTWVRALGDKVLVDIIDRGEKKTSSGIIVLDDDFKESGIRPRYAVVLASGPIAREDGLEPGDTVIILHGDWSRKIMDAEFDDGTKRGVWMTESSRILAVKKWGE